MRSSIDVSRLCFLKLNVQSCLSDSIHLFAGRVGIVFQDLCVLVGFLASVNLMFHANTSFLDCFSISQSRRLYW